MESEIASSFLTKPCSCKKRTTRRRRRASFRADGHALNKLTANRSLSARGSYCHLETDLSSDGMIAIILRILNLPLLIIRRASLLVNSPILPSLLLSDLQSFLMGIPLELAAEAAAAERRFRKWSSKALTVWSTLT